MREQCDSSVGTRSTANVLHFRDAKRSRRRECKMPVKRRASATVALRLCGAGGRIRKERLRDGIAEMRRVICTRSRAGRIDASAKGKNPPTENKKPTRLPSGFCGAGGRIRTADLFITSESLCLLSHTSLLRFAIISNLLIKCNEFCTFCPYHPSEKIDHRLLWRSNACCHPYLRSRARDVKKISANFD